MVLLDTDTIISTFGEDSDIQILFGTYSISRLRILISLAQILYLGLRDTKNNIYRDLKNSIYTLLKKIGGSHPQKFL